MRQPVTLQSRSDALGTFGAETTFTTVGTLGANIRAFSLSEVTALNRESTIEVLQFDFNYGATSRVITTNHRLIYGGNNYDVISVNTANAFDQANGKTVRVLAERRS